MLVSLNVEKNFKPYENKNIKNNSNWKYYDACDLVFQK